MGLVSKGFLMSSSRLVLSGDVGSPEKGPETPLSPGLELILRLAQEELKHGELGPFASAIIVMARGENAEKK
jgi:hypothetical protein